MKSFILCKFAGNIKLEMKKTVTLLFLALLCLSPVRAGKLTRYVDPMIGTTNFSVCNPVPWCPMV